MARVKGGIMAHKRRKKVLKLAKGFYGAKSKQFRTAKQAVMKSGQYAYIGRKNRKRDFRKLWIVRISAACRLNDINYSTFINGLKKADIELNRKMLSEIAIADPKAFTELTKKAKSNL
ncbi:MAG: 50S ribosomal protein L20 [Oscillospiraceae bacterium]